MRGIVAVVLGLAAVVVGLVTVPTAWVAQNISSEDGYVALTEPLVSDAELQDAVAAYVGETIVDRASLPDSLQANVTAALAAAVRRAGSDPGFGEAWSQTQARSHRATFGPDGDGDVVLDVAPLAAYLTDEVGTSLPAGLSPPGSLPVVVSEPEPMLLTQVAEAPDRALLGGAATVVLALGALMVARRRGTALAWLGAGAVAVAGVLAAARDVVVPELIDRSGGTTELGRTLQQLLAERVTDSLGAWLLVVAIGGGVAVVAGLLLRLVSARR